MSRPLRVASSSTGDQGRHRPTAAFPGPPGSKSPGWLVLAAISLGLVGVVVLVNLLLSRHELTLNQAQVAQLQEERTVLTQELEALKKPDCSDAEGELAQVRDFLARGQRGTAIVLVEAALNQEGRRLCPGARSTLAVLWYGASIDELLATPGTDDLASRNAALKWLTIERKADGYGVATSDRLAPMTVAQRAYSAGLWPLADVSFRKAWEAGHIGLESAGFRYALLRNWGNELAFRGQPAVREEGVSLLATAQAIAKKYSLNGRGEACADLQRLGFADCRQVTPDNDDPLLAGAGQ